VPVRVGGFAKGSGMIHPNMATMLCVITCDAAVAPPLWREVVRRGAVASFNQVRPLPALAGGPGRALCLWRRDGWQGAYGLHWQQAVGAQGTACRAWPCARSAARVVADLAARPPLGRVHAAKVRSQPRRRLASHRNKVTRQAQSLAAPAVTARGTRADIGGRRHEHQRHRDRPGQRRGRRRAHCRRRLAGGRAAGGCRDGAAAGPLRVGVRYPVIGKHVC